MAVVTYPVPAIMLSPLCPLRTIEAVLTRGGASTSGEKVVRVLDPQTFEEQVAIRAIDGRSAVQTFAAAVFDTAWLFLTVDPTAPSKADSRFVTISADTSLTIDIQDGGGAVGLPAVLDAKVLVSALPAQRSVVAVERQPDSQWRVAGTSITDIDGEASLDLRVTGAGLVYVVAIDDWGVIFQAGLTVVVGTVIRPSLFQGWLYRVTQAGQLPVVEPAWWDESLADPQVCGTARAQVVRYFRPLAHGPVPVTMM